MQQTVLFGIAHSKNHNNTEFVRGLFEVEDQFFYFSPESFKCSQRIKPDLIFPEHGDIIAFSREDDFDPKNSGFLIFDQMPGVKQFNIGEIIDTDIKPLMPLPKNLLSEKFQSDPLIDAVKTVEIKSVQEMLENGADANSSDEKGSSALLHSIVKQNIELTTLLIVFGADVTESNLAGVSPTSLAKDRFKGILPTLAKAEEHAKTLNWIKDLRNLLS